MLISEMEEDMSTKEKILDAALTLFAENGYDGTYMLHWMKMRNVLDLFTT